MTGEEYVGKGSLSGRYTYHSSKDNMPLFVREGVSAFGLVGRQFFFNYREGHWMITNRLIDNERFSWNTPLRLGAFLRLETKGTFYA